MAKGKSSTKQATQAVAYQGVSPEEIQRQYQVQQDQLKAQEQAFQAQYQQQYQTLRQSYDQSIGILTQQMQQREQAQSTLVGQLNTQLQAASQQAQQTQGLYDTLLQRQEQAAGLAGAEREKASVQRQVEQQNAVLSATNILGLLGRQRSAAQTANTRRGSTAAYSQGGQAQGLLR